MNGDFNSTCIKSNSADAEFPNIKSVLVHSYSQHKYLAYNIYDFPHPSLSYSQKHSQRAASCGISLQTLTFLAL